MFVDKKNDVWEMLSSKIERRSMEDGDKKKEFETHLSYQEVSTIWKSTLDPLFMLRELRQKMWDARKSILQILPAWFWQAEIL